MMNPRDLTPILKKLKVKQKHLVDEMGYSLVHISRVFCGKIEANAKFCKLLVAAILKKLKKHKADKKEFINFVKETEWKKYLP